MAAEPPPLYSEYVHDNQSYIPEESVQALTVYCREEAEQSIPSASEAHISASRSLHSEEKRPSDCRHFLLLKFDVIPQKTTNDRRGYTFQPYATVLMWFVVILLGIAGLVFPVHAVSLTVSYMLLRGNFGLLTLDAAIPQVELPKPSSLAHFTFDVIGYLWYTISVGSRTFLITNVPFRYTALLTDRCSILVVDSLFVIIALRLRFYSISSVSQKPADHWHPNTSGTCRQ